MSHTDLSYPECCDHSKALSDFGDATIAMSIHEDTVQHPAVSDDPPSLIVCVNRNSGANSAIKTNGRLCVNVLSCDQETVSAAFSNPSVVPARRFDTGEWQDSPIGNPVLAETAAYFDCEVDKAVEYGTHTVFFCKALDISVSQATTCLIYQGRAYHKIEGFG